MPKDSPLLTRACRESSKKGFPIPRRGRIRLFLLLILLGVGLWYYYNRKNPPQKGNDTQAVTKETKEKADKRTKSKKNKKAKKEKRAPKKPSEKKPRTLSAEKVKELMVTFPPTFLQEQETITFRNGTFQVQYSIDTALQRVNRKLFKQYHPKYGAAVVLEPATGRVLSLVSYTREGEVIIGKNLFGKNIFPAASIFKTVTAAAAIEKAALTCDSKLRTLGSNHTLYNSQLVKEPKQFREISFAESFAYSINPVFGRIGLFMLGADGLNEYANKFGFNAAIPFELKNSQPIYTYPDTGFAVAEIACGFNQATSISPLFGAMIAGCVSNRGKMYAPTIIDSIIDPVSKKTEYIREKILWRMPVQPETADELVLLMKKVARYGTARKSFRYIKQSFRFKEVDYGGKTGNVDKDGLGKVDWFVGFCRHKTDPGQHDTHMSLWLFFSWISLSHAT
jgi:membrane peptidoglycan carboxypeptidase